MEQIQMRRRLLILTETNQHITASIRNCRFKKTKPMKKQNITAILCGLILFITSCGGSTTEKSVAEGETTAKSVAEGETTAKSVDEVAIGQTKRMSVNFVRLDNEHQIGGYIFTNLSNSSELELSYNQMVNLPGFYEGISLESIVDYTNQNLVIDMIYMHHLCNEGASNYSCLDWVITGIYPEGGPKSTRKIILPKIGKIIDPDGYVNVRSQMNMKSSIVGKLETMNMEEFFYFYPSTDINWYKVDFDYFGVSFKGYIHASGVKIIH